MIRARLIRWLLAPPLSGWLALVIAVLAVAIPTAIRAAMQGSVTGCEFTPYLPFVLVSAVLLRWWQAGMVALASVTILGGLFAGPPVAMFDLACFISGSAIFLASSAAMIGLTILVRRAVASLQGQGTDGAAGGVIFSLEKGEVWATWRGQGMPVRLGTKRRVSEMMKDFLAHSEDDTKLGRRFW